MSPEQLERVKSAHARALGLSGPERDDFLLLEFPDEPLLRDEVKRLLDWHDKAGDFLSTPLTSRIFEPVAPDLAIQRVGPYQLIRELGRGSSATVYLARSTDGRFAQPVAIKVLNRLSHSEEVFRRFQREIQILARVEHPYIVRLLEADVTGEGLAYIVTEFVDGKPVDGFGAGLSIHERLSLFVKVCEGVREAHRNLIVHRDIKPSNILVTDGGTPKVLDFGIALLLDEQARLTETGLDLMTIQYASPEQIRREKTITSSSDVYSLGVVLYELVSGHLPFPYPVHEIPARVLSADPKRIDAPRDLTAIVWTALRKDPGERYQSVEALRDDISRYLDGLPVLAAHAPPTYLTGQFLRRRWRASTPALASVMLALAWIFFSPASRTPARIQISGMALPSPSGHPLSLSFSADGKRLYYLAGDTFFDYMDLFVKVIRSGNVSQLTADGAYKEGPIVSRDDKLILFSRAVDPQTDEVVLQPAGGGKESKLFSGIIGSVAWGADNHSLIVPCRSEDGIWPRLRGFDIRRHEWWDITAPPREGRGDNYPVLSPDGKTLCFVRQESRESADLFLLKVDSAIRPLGTPERLTSRRLRVGSPHWTPDGREIVYLGGTLGALHLYRVAADGRSEPVQITEAGSGFEAIAMSPDGRQLVLERWKTEANVWRLDLDRRGERVVAQRKLAASAEGGSFSPDGNLVAFLSARSGEMQVWVANPDGTAARRITSYSTPDGLAILWLPDSSGLVVNVRSRALGTRNFVVSVRGPEHELTAVRGAPCSFSRDGKWLYFSLITKDIDIYKYSMANGEIRQVTHDARGSYAVESPDGRTVYFSKPEAERGLWRIPAGGGEPTQVLPNLARRTLFVPRDEGIYYVARQSRSAVIELHPNFSGNGGGQDLELYRTKAIPHWGFSLSPNGRSLLYGQQDLITSEVLLIENFH